MISRGRRFEFVEESYRRRSPGHQLRRLGAGGGSGPDALARESHAAPIQSGYVNRDRIEFCRLVGGSRQLGDGGCGEQPF